MEDGGSYCIRTYCEEERKSVKWNATNVSSESGIMTENLENHSFIFNPSFDSALNMPVGEVTQNLEKSKLWFLSFSNSRFSLIKACL